MPNEELEEIPLAPEDTELLQREAALEAERQRIERQIRRERPADDDARKSPARPAAAANVSGPDLRGAVQGYLLALSRSDLAGADQYSQQLRGHRSEVIALLDQLAADGMPPPALAQVPPGVYQGFLKHLRAQL